MSDKCTRGDTCRNRDREVGLSRVSGIWTLTGRVRNPCVARWPLHYHNRILSATSGSSEPRVSWWFALTSTAVQPQCQYCSLSRAEQTQPPHIYSRYIYGEQESLSAIGCIRNVRVRALFSVPGARDLRSFFVYISLHPSTMFEYSGYFITPLCLPL